MTAHGMAASHLVPPPRNTGSSTARTGHNAAAGTVARNASVIASSTALTPNRLATRSSGHAVTTPNITAASTAPNTSSGTMSRRRAVPTCSMAFACTIEAPSRCNASVEKSIHSDRPRCQPSTLPPPPRTHTLKMSVLSRIASCMRNSFACTSCRRLTGAGNKNCTSAWEKASALRSPPNSHHRAADSSAFIVPVLDDHGALCGILSKSDFIKDIPRQLILVDHNELDQAVRGADQTPIIEILDHHRLGGITSATPVLFWNNPVGSTSTIVALSFQQHGIAIPPRIAGLLLAGLISDTLNLNSPTTTQTDRTLRETLARIAGVDADTFAQELFSVGSPLLTLTPQQAITADSKPYTEDGHRFLVAQIEELTLANFPARSEALLAALDAQRAAEKVLFTALLITDITTQSSLLLASGDDRFLSRIQHPRIAPNLWQLDGIVSRKKQLLPYLIECLGKMSPG